jgi:hypothetical protein
MQAIAQHLEEQREEVDNEDFLKRLFRDEHAPPDVTVRTDPEARKLADTPHLTGDPEWDEIELRETDPTRPTLRERGLDNG